MVRFAVIHQTLSIINRSNRCAAAQKKADPQSLGFSPSGLLNSLNLINLNVLERLTGSVPIHSSWVAAAFAWTLCKFYDLNVLHELLFATPMAPFARLSSSSYRSNNTGSVCFRKSNTIIHKSSKSLLGPRSGPFFCLAAGIAAHMVYIHFYDAARTRCASRGPPRGLGRAPRLSFVWQRA